MKTTFDIFWGLAQFAALCLVLWGGLLYLASLGLWPWLALPLWAVTVKALVSDFGRGWNQAP